KVLHCPPIPAGRRDLKSCIVLRYPQGAVIDRWVDTCAPWRAVCLLMSPRAVAQLMDVPASRLPGGAAWLAHQGALELYSRILPLQSAFVVVAQEIFACAFQGGARHAYLRAKSLE